MIEAILTQDLTVAVIEEELNVLYFDHLNGVL